MMRTLLVTGLILGIAVTAFAGGNPLVQGYIDFDPPNKLHAYMPTPYETFNAYICFGELEMGLAGCSFMMNDVTVDCPGAFSPPVFTNILPGDLAIGNYLTGITLASTDCMIGTDVCVAYVTLFYLGTGECCLQLLDHPEYPRWVLDCNDPAEVDFYCLSSHGSIGGGSCPEGDCDSPTDENTWGGIKALYR